MRMLSISKDAFDMFLYPSFTSGGSKDENQLEVAFRIRRKFRTIASSEELDLEITRDIRKRGGVPIANLKLNEPYAEIVLEEDEYNLLLERLLSHLPSFSNAVADDLYEFLMSFKKLEKISATKENV